MVEYPTQNITIYHKNGKQWEKYVKEASYRNTSVLNHNKNGTNSSENALIRVFDVEEYNKQWFVQKDDVIVNRKIDDEIEGTTPITQLSQKYGRENVHKITSIDVFIFKDNEIKELNHIKMGCI